MPIPQFKTLWSKLSSLCLVKLSAGVRRVVSVALVIGLGAGGAAYGKAPTADRGVATHGLRLTCELSSFPECGGDCPPYSQCKAIPESQVILPSPELPPDGDPLDCDQIVSQYEGDGVHALFPGGIDFSDPKHKCFQNVLRADVGLDEMETFDSTLEGLVNVGGGPVPVTLTGPVQVMTFNKVGHTTGTFETEIISMTLTGEVDGLTIVIRESPTLASTGQTTITDLGGGLYQIESFFDVFTELSTGGPFEPQTNDAGRMTLVSLTDGACECVPWVVEIDFFPWTVGQILLELPGGISTDNPQLPPTDGVYRSPSDVHAEYLDPVLEVVLRHIRHRPLADPPPVITNIGSDELEQFASLAVGTAIITTGGVPGPPVPVELTGPVETMVYGKADQTTGSWDAEIISMSLSGNLPDVGLILVRESPTQASTGQAVVASASGGLYHIDSFFDVFTELSVDGGDTWIAATGSVRMDLVHPELVSAVGPAEVHVQFEGPTEGVAHDDDTNGVDEVETELVSMDLLGSSSLGPVAIGLRGDVPSVGEIAEQVNVQSGLLEVPPFVAPGDVADSFFDVSAEIWVGGQPLHTTAPLLLETGIAHKPPQDGERYVNPYLDPVELIDPVTGMGTGIFVVREVHQPDPTVEHDVFTETTAVVGLDVPPLGLISVTMNGPSSVDVYFEGPLEGDAVDDDFNGLDEVITEMKTLDLQGNHPVLGDVYLRLNAYYVTVGQIKELVNNTPGRLDVDPFHPGDAESFFDVFFEVEIPSQGLLLHNETAARMEGIITYKPPAPGDEYVKTQGPIELFDQDGLPPGIFLTEATHVPTPPGVVEIDVFPHTVGQILLELPGGISTDNPQLPPTDGVYRSPSDVHAEYLGPVLEIVLQHIRHRPLADPPPVITNIGPDELEQFVSLAVGTAIITTGGVPGPPVPVELTGPVETMVYGKADQTTGSWDAEIISMSLSGNLPDVGLILVRESPTLASTGHTNVVSASGGLYHIDSFFDVFTELSVDGGDTWIASTGSVRMDLVHPELVSAVGPAEVHVRFEGPTEGVAHDGDSDGLDEVETELVSMDLLGSSSLGVVEIGLRSGIPSLGEIAEQVNVQSGLLEVPPFVAPGDVADSFFDVSAEIWVDGQPLHTTAPLLLETVIAHKPPQDGERYVNPYLDPVELIDPITGEGTGVFVVREVHQPAPTIEHDVFTETTAVVGLDVPALGLISVTMSGPSSVDVYFEGPLEGDAEDDDFNGLDEVITEMKTLDLQGNHPALGDVYLRLNANYVTVGQIKELVNNTPRRLDVDPFHPGDAESFFDVFFEVEIGGSRFYNHTPARMEGIITHKPPGPGDEYIKTQAPIELYDENGEPTGIIMTEASHVPNPRTDACCLPDGTCMMIPDVNCLASGGVPQGPGTVCTAPEACCLFPECFMLDPLCCDHMGGIPLGPGSQCTDPEACCTEGSDCLMDDPLCCGLIMGMPQGSGTVCTAPEACCFPNGTCQMLDPLCCDDLGGVPQGLGSECWGMGACCWPDGGCEEMDGLCCLDGGGSPQPPGSECWGMMACVFPVIGICMDMDGICCMSQGGTPLEGELCLGVEACCFPDDTCTNVDALICPSWGGVPQGSGSQCSGMEACCDSVTGTCSMADALCCSADGDTPLGPGTSCGDTEACCFDGGCQDLDPQCCLALGGVPQGSGTGCSIISVACCLMAGLDCEETDPLCCDEIGGLESPLGSEVCLGDNNGDGVDDACVGLGDGACCFGWNGGACLTMTEDMCTFDFLGTYQGDGSVCGGTGVCCLPGGGCEPGMDALCCVNEFGGTESPIGSDVCLGDGNGNGIDDACELPSEPPDPERGGPDCQFGFKFCHDLAGTGSAIPCLTDLDCPPEEFCWDDCWSDWRAANCIVYDHITGAARCYIPKNRYMTIDPAVNDSPVAYHVALIQLDDQYGDHSCLPLTGWLSEPVCRDADFGCPVSPQPPPTDPCQGPGQFGWVSYLVSDPVAPRIWQEYPLQVAGCDVVPAATYEMRASTDGVTPVEPPLILMTVHDPSGDAQHWGDVTSDPGLSLPWRPPEYVTSFSDVSAVIRTFEGTGGPALEWSDIEIDHVVTFGDIDFVIKAFVGDTYPLIADITGGCVSEPARPLIGHEPCACPPGP